MKTKVLTKEELKTQVESVLGSIVENGVRSAHDWVKEYYLDGEAGEERFWVDYAFCAEPQHWNIFGIVHGGVAATLLDDCVGIAGEIAHGGGRVTTSSMSLEFVRAMRGERFRVHSEITHVGGHMVTGIGEIYDEEERLCATCMASYIVHGEGL